MRRCIVLIAALILDARSAGADGMYDFSGLYVFGGLVTVESKAGQHTTGPMIGLDTNNKPESGVHFAYTATDEIGGDAGGLEGEMRAGLGVGVGGQPLEIRVLGGFNAGSVGPAGWAGVYAQLAARIDLRGLIASAAWMRTSALVNCDQNRFDLRLEVPRVALVLGGQLAEYSMSKDDPMSGGGSSLLFYAGTHL